MIFRQLQDAVEPLPKREALARQVLAVEIRPGYHGFSVFARHYTE